MQQSSATPKKSRCREGVAEDCCILSILLAVPSCTYSFWHSVIPTSYFIFNDFYTCFTIFDCGPKIRIACAITCHSFLLPERALLIVDLC